MQKKLVTSLMVLILVLSLGLPVSADISVGVKKDDWIEYAVTYTGSPSQDHALNWARIDVTDVQGTDIYVSITSRYANGTSEIFNSTLNLKTGHLIDDFIIPANLKAKDSFLDQNQGNIAINGTEQRTYLGTPRTVVYASAGQNTYVWDQATGVSLEGDSQQPDYSMHTIVTGTNLWHSSTGFQIWVLIFVLLVVISIASIAVAVWLRKKKKA